MGAMSGSRSSGVAEIATSLGVLDCVRIVDASDGILAGTAEADGLALAVVSSIVELAGWLKPLLKAAAKVSGEASLFSQFSVLRQISKISIYRRQLLTLEVLPFSGPEPLWEIHIFPASAWPLLCGFSRYEQIRYVVQDRRWMYDGGQMVILLESYEHSWRWA